MTHDVMRLRSIRLIVYGKVSPNIYSAIIIAAHTHDLSIKTTPKHSDNEMIVMVRMPQVGVALRFLVGVVNPRQKPTQVLSYWWSAPGIGYKVHPHGHAHINTTIP